MPIYFYQTNQQLPLSLESIGNDWAQDDVARPDGYPYFHWLQTEQGKAESHLVRNRLSYVRMKAF